MPPPKILSFSPSFARINPSAKNPDHPTRPYDAVIAHVLIQPMNSFLKTAARHFFFCYGVLLAATCGRCFGQQTAQGIVWPGVQPDGSVLLHNQWTVRPAGRQIELGSCFPVNVAVEPAGRYAAVLHAGYGPHQVVAVDLT